MEPYQLSARKRRETIKVGLIPIRKKIGRNYLYLDHKSKYQFKNTRVSIVVVFHI